MAIFTRSLVIRKADLACPEPPCLPHDLLLMVSLSCLGRKHAWKLEWASAINTSNHMATAGQQFSDAICCGLFFPLFRDHTSCRPAPDQPSNSAHLVADGFMVQQGQAGSVYVTLTIHMGGNTCNKGASAVSAATTNVTHALASLVPFQEDITAYQRLQQAP